MSSLMLGVHDYKNGVHAPYRTSFVLHVSLNSCKTRACACTTLQDSRLARTAHVVSRPGHPRQRAQTKESPHQTIVSMRSSSHCKAYGSRHIQIGSLDIHEPFCPQLPGEPCLFKPRALASAGLADSLGQHGLQACHSAALVLESSFQRKFTI